MTSPRQQQSSLSPTQVQAISVAVADAVALGLHHFNSQRTGSGAWSSRLPNSRLSESTVREYVRHT